MVASCDSIYMTFWKDKTIEIKSGSVVAKGWSRGFVDEVQRAVL